MTTSYYCPWCETTAETVPCPSCGRGGLIDLSPSQEPCAYCGERPTWPIVWGRGDEASVIYLCEECDKEEVRYLQAEDEDSDPEAWLEDKEGS